MSNVTLEVVNNKVETVLKDIKEIKKHFAKLNGTILRHEMELNNKTPETKFNDFQLKVTGKLNFYTLIVPILTFLLGLLVTLSILKFRS